MLRTVLLLLSAILLTYAQQPGVRTEYQVRHVGSRVLYLNGGSGDGLAEGMTLRILRAGPGDAISGRKEIATVAVLATTSNSASCEVRTGDAAAIHTGDVAELSAMDTEVIRIARSARARRRYAQIVSFTTGDPVEEELREAVPRPELPEVNRARGHIGFEQTGFLGRGTGSGMRTSQEGIVLRADMTRLGGSYWNFTGYWRGRFTSRVRREEATLNDLLNRTYHLGVYYNNPKSSNVAGFGRLLIPWATSLSTIDGGYYARRVHRNITSGVFAGSTPDPTAWNYDPNRQLLGVFTSFDAGSFERVRYTSTVGAAVSRSHWQPERQFLFFENSLLLHERVSVFHNLEADKLAPRLVTGGSPRPRIARSFLTLRITAGRRLAFDVSHNHFRGVPTFDQRLIATGLLDRMLFQGWSGGIRAEVPLNAVLYANIGSNRRETDNKAAVNCMLGLAFRPRQLMPFRTDLRYSRFNSPIASGRYQSISFSRDVSERLRVELLAGQQNLSSALTRQSRTRYVNALVDYVLGGHYVLGGGWTTYRGGVQNYDQYFVNVGYRF